MNVIEKTNKKRYQAPHIETMHLDLESGICFTSKTTEQIENMWSTDSDGSGSIGIGGGSSGGGSSTTETPWGSSSSSTTTPPSEFFAE